MQEQLERQRQKQKEKQKEQTLQNQEKTNTEEIKSGKEHRMKVIVGLGNPTDQYLSLIHILQEQRTRFIRTWNSWSITIRIM